MEPRRDLPDELELEDDDLYEPELHIVMGGLERAYPARVTDGYSAEIAKRRPQPIVNEGRKPSEIIMNRARAAGNI